MDSALIEAPPSIKNREKQRDPDAHQTKKGNQWHFGYEAHIGVDKDSGLVQKVKVTAANISDIATMPELLTGEEEVVYGNSGYLGAKKRAGAILKNKQGKKIRYKINRRHPKSRIVLCGHRVNSSAGSGRNPLSGQKSSTFSLSSRGCSDTERRDTED